MAGVSVPTVSRVLNGRNNVAPDLIAKVNAAISSLDYRPSRAARRLRSQHSRLVGVVFSDISNPFYINVLKGIEHVLSRTGISLLISNADADPEREAEMLWVMRAEDVAGIIIAPSREDSSEIAMAVKNELPIVVFDRRMTDCDVDTVVGDGFAGARRAVRHLIDLGHRRIAIVSGPLRLSSARDRYNGYLEAMSSAGLDVDPALTRFGDYRLESGYDLTSGLLSAPTPATALFIANNQMTIGALNAIHDAKRRIPDDIAVVGFDDFDWAVSLNPPLTTVAQSTFDIGVNAATLLLARIENGHLPTRTMVLETKLQIRASCGAPKKGSATAKRARTKIQQRKG